MASAKPFFRFRDLHWGMGGRPMLFRVVAGPSSRSWCHAGDYRVLRPSVGTLGWPSSIFALCFLGQSSVAVWAQLLATRLPKNASFFPSPFPRKFLAFVTVVRGLNV